MNDRLCGASLIYDDRERGEFAEVTTVMFRNLLTISMLLTSAGVGVSVQAGELKAGAAAANLKADDALVIGGGIGPHKYTGQEGELRASAVVIEDPQGAKVALVACDVLMVKRDVLDRAARRIEQATGIPFDNILINATHTHHAPTTVTIHGYRREEAFTQQVGDKAVEAAVAANERLDPGDDGLPARRGVVGRAEQPAAARRRDDLLGRARTTTPSGRPARSTPSCPVWAFRRKDGTLEAVLFNHSTHTIGDAQARGPLARLLRAGGAGDWRRSGAGRSCSSKAPRARRTTSTWPAPR